MAASREPEPALARDVDRAVELMAAHLDATARQFEAARSAAEPHEAAVP